ncbi:methylbutanoyltransferase [Hyphodiscus hymeniophilus]|uniref:Methylbutanoyltransferase n=1 Tax=Hyphodiscus hymeniophilus TaxID=353542 RepID=A0A9P6VRF0_9HELO|nr:methylbutanoyltransferase [Hyphodiscus hymeniophilus]
MTAISALQCVERGQFTLDEDVTQQLPELKAIQIQTGCDSAGNPVLEKAKNKITLRYIRDCQYRMKKADVFRFRHLLTHTSGLSYTKFGDLKLSLVERCSTPLLFEPGEGFIYGTGHDWAGIMVERVTGVSLESYIQQHIGGPLKIGSLVFRISSYPELYRRLVEVSIRKEDSGLQWTPETVWPVDLTENSGGSGAYASLVDYQKILHSITANDGRLLTSQMVDQIFRPEMSPVVRADVMKALKIESTNNIYGGLPKGTDVTYSMGGMVVLEDLPGRRPKGTVHWGGLLNVFFWMDRTTGVSGIYGSQVFPAGDPTCLGLFAEFESKTYEALNASEN